MSLTPNERKVLQTLLTAWNEYEDFCYLSFKPICKRTRLKRDVVRRACRSLKRKGFAQFGRGLWTDDGEVAGSGYACTKAGREALA